MKWASIQLQYYFAKDSILAEEGPYSFLPISQWSPSGYQVGLVQHRSFLTSMGGTLATSFVLQMEGTSCVQQWLKYVIVAVLCWLLNV